MTVNLHAPIRRVEALNVATVLRRGVSGAAARKAASERMLASAIRSALASLPEGNDDDVLIIDRVEIEVMVNPGISSARCQAFLDQAVATSIRKAIEDGAGVRRLPSRRHYLAELLTVAAARRIAGRWEFAAYEGLALLSPSQAVLSLLVDEPVAGLETLRLLPRAERRAVINALDSASAIAFLAALTRRESTAAPTKRQSSLGQATIAGVIDKDAEADLARAAILALVRCAEQFKEIDPNALVAAALVLCRARGDGADGAAAAEKARNGVLRLVASHPALCAAVRDISTDDILPYLRRPASIRPVADGEKIKSRWLGLSLLAPFLDEFLTPLAGAPEVEQAMARVAILARCAGAPDVTNDPALWAVLAFPDGLKQRELEQWSQGLSRDIASALAQRARLLAPSTEERALRPCDRQFLEEGRAPSASPGERALTLVAGCLLRRFVRQFTGFQTATARYIHRNFLDAQGVLEIKGDALVVRLARPPFGLVLSMAGVGRGRAELPWLGCRSLVFGALR